MRAATIAGLVLCVVGASLPRAAAAQHAPGSSDEALADEQARTHFESGRLYYKRGQFEQAASAFQAAYDLSGRPQLLYNIYLAHRDAGSVEPAAEALAGYLERVQDVPRREHLEARLAALRERIDDDGDPQAVAGSGAETDPDAGADPGPQTPPATRSSSSSNAGVYALMGTGAAVVVAGAITGGLALKKQSDLQDRCTDERVCDPSLRDERNRGRALAIATDVLVPAGAVAAAVGVVLWLTGDDDEEGPAGSAACGPGGCAASVRLRF